MSIKGALKGLQSIKDKAESKKGGNFDGESPFLQLKDGDAFKIRVLQEFDDSFTGYDERKGPIVVVEEHTAPQNYKRRAVCTLEEEGHCWACQQVAAGGENAKKWKSKMRFYANVLVRVEEGDPKVKILAQGFGDKNVGTNLIEIAVETGGLTGQDMKLSRSGAKMNDTNYTIFPLPPKALTKAEKELEMIDLSNFIKFIPYQEQADYYNSTDEGGPKKDWLD